MRLDQNKCKNKEEKKVLDPAQSASGGQLEEFDYIMPNYRGNDFDIPLIGNK